MFVLKPTRSGLVALFCVCMLSLVSSASATPEILASLKKFYAFKQGSPADTAKCLLCHTQPPQRNELGSLVERIFDKAGTREFSPETIQQIGQKDTDGDGATNDTELKLGTLPADTSSKPTQEQIDTLKPKTDSTDKSNQPKAIAAPLIPLHSFHPAVVHFPIALVVIGLLFEILGMINFDSKWKVAARLNLVFGAVSTAVAIPTGVIAWLRNGYELKGSLLIHLILEVVGTLLLLLALYTTRKTTERNAMYYLLLLIAAILIGLGGHFGSLMVYG